MHKQRIGLVVAAGVGMVGSFLPWMHGPAAGVTRTGTELGDGWVTLFLFVPAVILGLAGDRARPLSAAATMAAVLPAVPAGLTGVWVIERIYSPQMRMLAAHVDGRVTTGVGPPLVLAAAAGLVAAALLRKSGAAERRTDLLQVQDPPDRDGIV